MDQSPDGRHARGAFLCGAAYTTLVAGSGTPVKQPSLQAAIPLSVATVPIDTSRRFWSLMGNAFRPGKFLVMVQAAACPP